MQIYNVWLAVVNKLISYSSDFFFLNRFKFAYDLHRKRVIFYTSRKKKFDLFRFIFFGKYWTTLLIRIANVPYYTANILHMSQPCLNGNNFTMWQIAQQILKGIYLFFVCENKFPTFEN